MILIRTKLWNKKREIPTLFLLINSVVWFSASWLFINDLMTYSSFREILSVSSFYFGSLLVSAIIGATLLKKKLRGKWSLMAWILLGTAASILTSTLVHGTDSGTLSLLSIPLGASAGLGIPTCLSLFSETYSSKNRGRKAAVVFFLIQALTALIYIIGNGVNLEDKFLILAAWRIAGIICIFLLVPNKIVVEEPKIRLSSIIRERTFLLYFIPWFLFTIVNFIEQPLLEMHFADYGLYSIIGILITSITSFFGGALCDFKGRKVSAILGFILLGLGYAFLSLFSGVFFFQILWVLLEGMAWGILYVTFIFVVWGDISDGRTREHYYLLGCMPFLLSNLFSSLVRPFAGSIEIASTFSIASFFLFVAILPLLYAPETLAEKVMKDRDLKSYLDKAMKQLQKQSEKVPKEQNQKTENDETEFKAKPEENEEEYEEAQKLAEKYY